jgi:hypothetical protein
MSSNNLIKDKHGVPRVEGCDAERPPVYSDGHGGYTCRCLICARCGHHTGNNTQGHFWRLCNVQMKLHYTKHKAKNQWSCTECMPDYHQCCPGDCSLFNEDGTRKNVNEQN